MGKKKAVKATVENLDAGQLDVMFNFLKLRGENTCDVRDVRMLKENLDYIRQALIQKGENKHGEWLSVSTGYNVVRCSECQVCFDAKSSCVEEYNYCPYCGAKMTISEETKSKLRGF